MPPVPLKDRPLAFIDTETTGLQALAHEIIDIAIIREWPDGRVDEWSTKVRPMNIESAEPIALQVNGYTPEAWADAPTFAEVQGEVVDHLLGCILVGHNVSFDLDFITDALHRCGNRTKLPYHKIDTVTLAFEHLVPRGLTSLSLDSIRTFYGWPKDGAHTALVDARDARRVFHQLARPKIIPADPDDVKRGDADNQ